MGFRFRKSYKIAPGIKVNVGKKSAGISVGGKHGGMSFNSKTGTRARVSAPGTGMSYSTKVGTSRKKTPSKNSGCLTSALSVLFIIMLFASCSGIGDKHPDVEPIQTEAAAQSEIITHAETVETTENIQNPYKIVDGFIDTYNGAYPDSKIENLEEVTVSDKESEHYRHEFRLTAYEDAISKYGTIGESGILVVNYGSMGLDGLRIYVTCQTLESSIAEFLKILPILYPEVSDDEISEIESYIEERGDYSSLIGNWSVYINRNGADKGGYTVFFDDNLYTWHTENKK